MTSKVRVDDSGDTTLLPGEILKFKSSRNNNAKLLYQNEEPPLYYTNTFRFN